MSLSSGGCFNEIVNSHSAKGNWIRGTMNIGTRWLKRLEILATHQEEFDYK